MNFSHKFLEALVFNDLWVPIPTRALVRSKLKVRLFRWNAMLLQVGRRKMKI